MRNVLIVIGIAVAAIIVSAMLNPPRGLNPAPQEVAADAKDREIEAERKKAEDARRKELGAMPDSPAPSAAFSALREGAVQVTLSIENRGDVVLELYPQVAPKTVKRITELVKSGFYDKMRFHRVEANILVQAGDPKTKDYGPELATMLPQQIQMEGIGGGGSGKLLEYEDSGLPNAEGAIAIALKGPRSNTGDSQFYINLVANNTLDGQYCVFGRVVTGMKAVRSVVLGDLITRASMK